MEAGFGIEVLAGEAEVDGRAARRGFLPERAGVPAPHRAAPRIGGITRGQEMVGMEIEDRLRAARIDLRQRLAVEIHIFPDQVPRTVILTQQRPARAVDVMGGIAPRDLLRAGIQRELFTVYKNESSRTNRSSLSRK